MARAKKPKYYVIYTDTTAPLSRDNIYQSIDTYRGPKEWEDCTEDEDEWKILMMLCNDVDPTEFEKLKAVLLGEYSEI